jgi:translation elongation factor EF-Tu-like GTPase
MRKVYMLNAIGGAAMFTGKPTAFETLVGRGTMVTLEVRGAAVNVGDLIKIRLKDGTLKDSIVSGIQVGGAVQDTATKGETAVLLVREVTADELSLTNCFVWAKI